MLISRHVIKLNILFSFPNVASGKKVEKSPLIARLHKVFCSAPAQIQTSVMTEEFEYSCVKTRLLFWIMTVHSTNKFANANFAIYWKNGQYFWKARSKNAMSLRNNTNNRIMYNDNLYKWVYLNSIQTLLHLFCLVVMAESNNSIRSWDKRSSEKENSSTEVGKWNVNSGEKSFGKVWGKTIGL